MREVHGDTYEYIEDSYKDGISKMMIICSVHGVFKQSPHAHLQGQGCPECGRERANSKHRLSFDEVVGRANKIHNNKYTYPPYEIKSIKDKIPIICPQHGKFRQSVLNHIYCKTGCPHCLESKGERKISTWLDTYGISYMQR